MSIEKYLQAHYATATAKAYAREIEIYQSNVPAAVTARYKDITGYLGLLRNRYSKTATISRILSSIKVYYDYLCREGIRNDNPARSLQLKDQQSRDIQLQDLFTTEELEGLLNRKERYHDLYYRNKVLMSLVVYQAVHPRELEALQVRDIDLTIGTVYIKATPKTSSRTLSLKSSQVLLFHQYITEIRPGLLHGHASSCLLIGLRGGAMKAGDITKHIKRSFKECYPNRKVTAQRVRQSVITNLLKQGHDISLVQAYAGHKYPSATQRYRQQELETLKAAVHKYHPLQ